MNKKDLDVLNRLMQDKSIKGKKSLERFIWLNTVEPKFKEGDKVKITDRSRTINGSRVIDWIGTVGKVRAMVGELHYSYEVKVKYMSVDNSIKETSVFANDYNINDIKKTRTKNDINKPLNTKEEESADIHF